MSCNFFRFPSIGQFCAFCVLCAFLFANYAFFATPISTISELSQQKADESKLSEAISAATSGKLFTAEKTRSFDFSKVQKILDSANYDDTKPKEDERPCSIYAVVTTIFEKTEAVSDILKNSDWCLVVVADLKSLPKETYGIPDNERYIFLSVEDQAELFPELSSTLPWNHFGRKNLGYLFAIQAGAELVWDFDDDNYGVIDLAGVLASHKVMPCKNMSLINPYMHFGVNETISWPRGFPLDRIRDEATWKFPVCRSTDVIPPGPIAVIQSLANNEPDVDAIYRLTRKTPFDFNTVEREPLVLPRGAFCPFNGQATMWLKSAFLFLFLPTSVHGRVSDIWRSYIAEHFFGQLGLEVIFTKPYVIQRRNPHKFLGDFDSEHDLYIKAPAFLDYLQTVRHEPGDSLGLNVLQLYIDLYERNIVGEEDVLLFAHWMKSSSSFENLKITQHTFGFPSPVSTTTTTTTTSTTTTTTSTTTIKAEDELLMLGILSIESHIALRNAQRETFLSENKFGHRFLFDRVTPTLLEEQAKFGDVVFLNSTYTGNEIAFGEKILLWLKYARQHFPNYTMYGKADDDVFICTDEFMNTLTSIASPFIHYGWWHLNHWRKLHAFADLQGFSKPPIVQGTESARKNRFPGGLPSIDEQFIIIGRDLVDPIIHPSRKHCIPKQCTGSKFAVGPATCKDPEHCISAQNNWDTNYGGTSVIYWLADTSPSKLQIYIDNDNILHYPSVHGYQSKKGKPRPDQNICELYYISHPNKDANAIYDAYQKSKESPTKIQLEQQKMNSLEPAVKPEPGKPEIPSSKPARIGGGFTVKDNVQDKVQEKQIMLNDDPNNAIVIVTQ